MTAQLAPNSMSLPPPAQADLDLLDRNRLVGWVRGWALGFRGFASESEAAGAAWVAYRTLARRLARRHGGRPAPIDAEPLSLGQDGDGMVILASGRPIATLVLPGVDSLSAPDSFGFEIQGPLPADELSMRSLAYRIYRTLRKSGARWAMWERRRVNQRRVAARRQPPWVPTRRSGESSPAAIVFVSKFVLTGIAIALGAAVIAAAPRTVIIPIGMVLAAGLVARGLVALVERWRAARSRGPARRRPARSAAAHATALRDHARLRNDDPSDESMREFGWLALGTVSIAVLVLALVVPEELAVAFVAIGLAGLVVFRLSAAWVGWVPERTARVDSRSGSEASPPQRESTAQVSAWRSNGARGESPQGTADESRNGTSPRLVSN
jgi:hypothetical protein